MTAKTTIYRKLLLNLVEQTAPATIVVIVGWRCGALKNRVTLQRADHNKAI